MLVAKLTIHQKDSLVGQLIQPDWYFGPAIDGDGDWIITQIEINASIYPEHEWVKDLELSEWVPPVNPD